MVDRRWIDVPVTVTGTWGNSRTVDVEAVVLSARKHALEDIAPVASRSPSGIVLLGMPDQPCPRVWAKDVPNGAATVILTSIDHRWAQLAYQFLHEFGHLLANSWGSTAIPTGPSHWLEEALVEAFSLHGLRRMAAGWPVNPPYPNFSDYAGHLSAYAGGRLDELQDAASKTGFDMAPADWLAGSGAGLDVAESLTDDVWPIIPWLVGEIEADRTLIGDFSALNRWSERGAVPLGDYLARWQESCAQIRSGGRLPTLIAAKLAIALPNACQ